LASSSSLLEDESLLLLSKKLSESESLSLSSSLLDTTKRCVGLIDSDGSSASNKLAAAGGLLYTAALPS
jgi:hypothetical protein